VTVASEPRRGTEVTLWLPQAQALAAAGTTSESAGAG
jgi:hypothetical protein